MKTTHKSTHNVFPSRRFSNKQLTPLEHMVVMGTDPPCNRPQTFRLCCLAPICLHKIHFPQKRSEAECEEREEQKGS